MTWSKPARQHLDQGLQYVRHGDYAAAVSAFTSAVQNGADSAQVFFQRGAAYYNLNENERADTDLSAAIEKDSNPARYHLFRGLTRLRLNQLDLAITDLTFALERDPELIDAAWARGRILADRGEWSLAARDFGRVIALKPNDALAYSMRGEMYHRLRDWSRCLNDYQLAMTFAPNDPKCLNRVAWILATCPRDEIRDGPAAVELAQRANQLIGGGDPLILDTLAAAYAECRQWPPTLATILQALRIRPEDQQLLAHQSAFRASRPWREQ